MVNVNNPSAEKDEGETSFSPEPQISRRHFLQTLATTAAAVTGVVSHGFPLEAGTDDVKNGDAWEVGGAAVKTNNEKYKSKVTVDKEKKTITVPAKEAYGAYNQTLVYKVAKSKLPVDAPKVGDVFEAGNGQNNFPVTVISVDKDEVVLDGNHPLAGQDLTFEVEITQRRMATVEEVAHGHAHGLDGCGHSH